MPFPTGTSATNRLASQPLEVSVAPRLSEIRVEPESGAISTDGVPCPPTIVPPTAVQFRFEYSDAFVIVAFRLPVPHSAFDDSVTCAASGVCTVTVVSADAAQSLDWRT